MRIFGTKIKSRFLIFFTNIAKHDCQTQANEQETRATRQERAVRNFPRGRDVMAVSPTGVRKGILFALTRQELSFTQSTRTTLLRAPFFRDRVSGGTRSKK